MVVLNVLPSRYPTVFPLFPVLSGLEDLPGEFPVPELRHKLSLVRLYGLSFPVRAEMNNRCTLLVNTNYYAVLRSKTNSD